VHPKIKTLSKARALVARLKKKGKKIVFTNGCFDLLHFGHVSYLRRARALGDFLIVGLNSDDSVRRLKGKQRPFNSQKDRAEILSELSSVDCVTIFREDTPLRLLKSLKPHILVKGSDWSRNEIVGREVVESYGGEVKRISLIPGRSTTRLIRRSKQAESSPPLQKGEVSHGA
jgi:D-beta-D-heptose 7-phosphate kinase/D-beta-D-heptose 1-phosphate adenosyltransferase